jgi:hypothetical protein
VFTANNIAIHSAEIDFPLRRIWLANLTFTDDLGPAVDERVTLTLGSWTGVGTCVSAGAHGGVYKARVVAGAGGWRRAPTGLSFQNDANLSTIEIAQALASSVGETVTSDSTTIGVNWSIDPQCSAGENLDAVGNWYVDNAGVTVIGDRPELAEFKAIVENYDGSHAQAECLIEEQDIAKVLPGAIVSSVTLPASIRVKHTRVLVSTNKIVAEVYANEQDPFPGARSALRKTRYLGTYRYRIIEQIDERLQLQAVDTVAGLPDQVLVSKAHGLPGVTTECAPAGEVLIVFADGNRSRPFVSAYLGSSLDIVHTTASATFTTSAPLPSPEPVALAPAVDALQQALLTFCSTIAAAPNPAAAALLLQPACATLAGSLGDNIRTGSIVLEAQ